MRSCCLGLCPDAHIWSGKAPGVWHLLLGLKCDSGEVSDRHGLLRLGRKRDEWRDKKARDE